jgi:hypothetical protein
LLAVELEEIEEVIDEAGADCCMRPKSETPLGRTAQSSPSR